MKVVVQRVDRASVEVDGSQVASIERGFLVLVGVAKGDSQADAAYLAKKTANLRIFEDDDGKMNLPLAAVGGEVLAVSQFTLLADTRKGNRPGFAMAADPVEGNRLYEYFCEQLAAHGVCVAKGVFGAHMHVSLLNDGPVTIIIESVISGGSPRE